jgi:ABC-type multidrug transport system ATPase subunit
VKILTTLLHPDSGKALIEGLDVVKQSDAVRRRIGLAGQSAAIQEELTGRENLEIMGRLHHLSKAVSRDGAQRLLAGFDLVDAADRPAKTYSGGMLRRLDLAASLVGSPSVLFLDEPTTGLDPRSRLGMWSIIRELVAGGTTLLLTTQYLDEADELADEIVVIDHGLVIAAGTPQELKTRVGGHVLQARPADPSDAEKTERIMSEFAASGESTHSDSEVVSVTINDRSALGEVVRRLDDAGITVDDLSLRRPSLDEVFLAVTGHLAEGEAETEDPTERSSR